MWHCVLRMRLLPFGSAVLLRSGGAVTWGAGNPRAGHWTAFGATGHRSTDDVCAPRRVGGVRDAAGCATAFALLAIVERTGVVKVCGHGQGDALGQGNENDELTLVALSGRALAAPM